jgi:hypothetical protein
MNDPNLNVAGLAKQLGRDRWPLYSFVRRLRKAGGWYATIVWKRCVQCGQPLATSDSDSSSGRRKLHAHCKEAYQSAKRKSRWAAMSDENRQAELSRLMATKTKARD